HGLAARVVAVAWEVAEDRGFRTIAAKGEALAWPEVAHTVHVEVAGLQPDRPYFYRFVAGGERSPIGRSRTLPAPGAPLASVRFGVIGCQHFEYGLYTAFRMMARDDPDFVFHYGDYIYEGRGGPAMVRYETGEPLPTVRRHIGDECYSLDDYRQRYAQEKLDLDLQFAHAAAPWLVSYDDHEIVNNWVGDHTDEGVPPEVFRIRRAAALQAWYENTPVRRRVAPVNGVSAMHRAFQYGDLLDARVLDTRQFRSPQPCDDRFGTTECAGVHDPRAEIVGPAQEKWLVDGLAGSKARWKAILQQVMMMDLDRARDDAVRTINPDSWAGYAVPRDRLLNALRDRRIGNVVALTGDEHQNFAGELRASTAREAAPAAIEFVLTSATSGGDGQDVRPGSDRILARNPGLKFINDQRGYGLCTVTPDRFETAFRVLDQVSRPGGIVSTRATLTVPNGASRIEPA
ncbi:MAG: alkaline phosphatase D family protein, partial [Janthinobacterium lividum]